MTTLPDIRPVPLSVPLFPLYEVGGKSTCPLGMPMCQNRLAVPTWSYAMEVLPPARIIELGTYNGAFIIALAVHAWNLRPKARVVSYDRIVTPMEQLAPLGEFLGVEFRGGRDIWECEAEIAEMIAAPGVTYLLCDGGDKPREFQSFAYYLKPGDVIAAHDYCVNREPLYWSCEETKLTDVEPAVKQYGLTPWLQPQFDMAAWLVYRKGGQP